jgi:hypothetical protein
MSVTGIKPLISDCETKAYKIILIIPTAAAATEWTEKFKCVRYFKNLIFKEKKEINITWTQLQKKKNNA